MEKIRVGLLGCGNISGIYAKNLPGFADVELVACADLEMARAEALRDAHGLPRAVPMEEFFEDPEIQLVLNLTVPSAHAEISLRALEAGKSVYNEKPLAVRRRDARQMLGLARERGLRIGCAPDTVLGAGIQTCRKLIDEGAIGRPVAATAFMLSRGMETWHPNPQFFYEKGAGPLFDMGPYYLTTLTALLGPVQSVQAMAGISFPERTITSQPLAGQKVTVRTPTHHSISLQFAAGCIGTMVTSFDVACHGLPNMEIYGEEGSLRVPDPNTFGGPVLLRARGENEWREMPLEFGYAENSRGLGVADLARAILTGRDHRCNERIAFHVLEIMHTALDSAESGRTLEVPSTMVRPEPLPIGLPPGRVDL
jgi:predicted dehydrogenase